LPPQAQLTLQIRDLFLALGNLLFGFRQFPVTFYQLPPQILVFEEQTIMLTFQPLPLALGRIGLLRRTIPAV
jgi:hypothetical protein